MNWKRLLAYITGSVNQELLLRNEYLATENRILRNEIKGRLQLNDTDRISLAEIGKRLGRKALEEVAQIVRPETILAWHRRLIAKKFDGSNKLVPRRPHTDKAIEELILKMARENRSWGYRRIVGALRNLGHEVSHQTVANVLERHGLLPAPERERPRPCATTSFGSRLPRRQMTTKRHNTIWIGAAHSGRRGLNHYPRRIYKPSSNRR